LAFKSRGFDGEIGVICSERLRTGYKSAYPALNIAFLVYLFTPCHHIQFPYSSATTQNEKNHTIVGLEKCYPIGMLDAFTRELRKLETTAT
jgi:hypothetical protein